MGGASCSGGGCAHTYHMKTAMMKITTTTTNATTDTIIPAMEDEDKDSESVEGGERRGRGGERRGSGGRRGSRRVERGEKGGGMEGQLVFHY